MRLSVYYHEPSKRNASVMSSLDGRESPTTKQQQQIKGMVFDKIGRCYYPADSGKLWKSPATSGKQRKSPVVGGLADVVLFKVTNVEGESDDKPESTGPLTTRQRLLNAARKKLLKIRKDD